MLSERNNALYTDLIIIIFFTVTFYIKVIKADIFYARHLHRLFFSFYKIRKLYYTLYKMKTFNIHGTSLSSDWL